MERMNGAANRRVVITHGLASMVCPTLASHLDPFPGCTDMATITLSSEITIMLVILFMTTETGSHQNNLLFDRGIVAIDTLQLVVLPFQLEVGFIVIEFPRLPVARVVTGLTTRSQCQLVRILFFMARPAIRFGILEYHS
jgi:hypothetical protein